MKSCREICEENRLADMDVGTWLVTSGDEVIAEFSDFMRAYMYRLHQRSEGLETDIFWKAGRRAPRRAR